MTQPPGGLVPFDTILRSVSALSSEEKLQIMEALHEQLEQAEEDLYERDPQMQAEIREARVAYDTKNNKTLKEYQTRDRRHGS
jgi:DNA-binding protein H-NS